MTRSYSDLIARKRAEHGPRFDPSDLAPQFVPYFESGARIEVRTTYPSGQSWTRRGRVGITTGWKPAFLLMARTNCRGSSDLLGPTAVVVKVVAP